VISYCRTKQKFIEIGARSGELRGSGSHRENLEFSTARPYKFPGNRSQVEMGSKRRAVDVKGAERTNLSAFAARRFAFLPPACRVTMIPPYTSFRNLNANPKIWTP